MQFECEDCGSDLHVNIEEAAAPSGYMILEVSEPVVTIHCAKNRSHNVTEQMKLAVLTLMRKNNLI
jgi:hypothetical protein